MSTLPVIKKIDPKKTHGAKFGFLRLKFIPCSQQRERSRNLTVTSPSPLVSDKINKEPKSETSPQ